MPTRPTSQPRKVLAPSAPGRRGLGVQRLVSRACSSLHRRPGSGPFIGKLSDAADRIKALPRFLGPLTCAFVLAACSSDSPHATHTTTVTPPRTTTVASTPPPSSTSPPPTTSGPVIAQAYNSITQLRDAAVAAGLSCPRWQQTNRIIGAAESADCSANAVLSTYATARDLQGALDRYESIVFGKSVFLVGPNWIINSPQAADLAAEMGGVVRRFHS